MTTAISLELIAPGAFSSNLKFVAVVTCPDRAFTPLMSLEFTEVVLFTSPTRKLIDAEGCNSLLPFTPVNETVTRELSGRLRSVTSTLLLNSTLVQASTADGHITGYGNIGRIAVAIAVFGLFWVYALKSASVAEKVAVG